MKKSVEFDVCKTDTNNINTDLKTDQSMREQQFHLITANHFHLMRPLGFTAFAERRENLPIPTGSQSQRLNWSGVRFSLSFSDPGPPRFWKQNGSREPLYPWDSSSGIVFGNGALLKQDLSSQPLENLWGWSWIMDQWPWSSYPGLNADVTGPFAAGLIAARDGSEVWVCEVIWPRKSTRLGPDSLRYCWG